MNILVVGSGGREHALCWKIAQSPRLAKLFCAPGNAGIAEVAECVPIAADDVAGLAAFARERRVALTIVGPEGVLAAGIADSFKRQNLGIFGPTREAALLESSKVYAKEFCRRYRIPSASSESFSDAEAAKAYLKTQPFPLVVKADGLAAGKGVVVCQDAAQAKDAVEEILVGRRFGDAGARVLVEEFLEGEEASFIAVCDGNHVLPLASSQDHKRAEDGDRGPNTGGMGAISPAPIMTETVSQRAMEEILLPAARGMVTEGRPFVGALYAGLMIRDGEPKLLEFNARFGDPETEPLMVRLKTDLVDLLEGAVEGSLHQISPEWDPRPAACVVMASGGYPGPYEKGKAISGLDAAARVPGTVLFHAGTRRDGDRVLTDGGRVLAVTALGAQMGEALSRAYEAVGMISWEGMRFRRDIGRSSPG